MEDRFYNVSRWLVAMAVFFIPLSVIILVAGVWSYNVQMGLNQWTRYLLFVSWVLMTVSIITGISNLIAPPLEEKGEETRAVIPEEEEGEGAAEGEKEKPAERPAKKGKINVGYAFLLAQAGTFLLGVVLYVVYVSWMILPYINIPKTAY
jgi:hypothetical protein